MGPNTFFDKSAVQILGRQHPYTFGAVNEGITPILLMEILADLSKDISNAQGRVAALARDFGGCGGVINVDWKLACFNSLTGEEPPMTGQFLLDYGENVVEPDGSSAILIEPTDGNISILRWARQHFFEDEQAFAAQFRKEAEAFEMGMLRGRLSQLGLPLVTSIERIPVVADDILDDETRYLVLLDWLCDQLRPFGRKIGLPAVRLAAKIRWQQEGRQHMRDFAPYAHHCARTLLMLVVGEKVLSQRPTNRLDLEYLLYLPFCELFVSQDTLHKQLVPFLIRKYQSFMWADDFKAQLVARTPFEVDNEDRFSSTGT